VFNFGVGTSPFPSVDTSNGVTGLISTFFLRLIKLIGPLVTDHLPSKYAVIEREYYSLDLDG
jgi:hypothetical protein